MSDVSRLPTTGEIRGFYLDEWNYQRDEPNSYGYIRDRGEEFDRWLESVNAEAWDEGYEARSERGEPIGPLDIIDPVTNPYREQ